MMPTGHIFEGQCTTRLRNLDSNRRFIKGCIILYIVRIFSSSELMKPHINPFRVRLAVHVELKEAAK